MILQPKTAAELVKRRFDFATETTPLTSPTVTVTVYAGTDASPSALLSGSASVDGSDVVQNFTGGTEGVIYKLVVTATDSAAVVRSRTAYLAVVPSLP